MCQVLLARGKLPFRPLKGRGKTAVSGNIAQSVPQNRMDRMQSSTSRALIRRLPNIIAPGPVCLGRSP
jgi:hypothetical protein